jgi:putative tryptophan/tyrosine transport system substrate-binding protein
MKRRDTLLGLIALAALPSSTGAQRRLWRIGYHSAGSAQSNAGWLDAFRQGMADHGWSEARNYVIDARYADGRSELLQRLAADLVASEPDVLLTTAESSIQALARSTNKIPIVFAVAADPVGHGLVPSLQRPGGNVTGLTLLSQDLAPKRLELLKDSFPSVSHVVLLYQGNDDASAGQVKAYADAAGRMDMRTTAIDLRQPGDIESAFKRTAALAPDAYAIASSFMLNTQARVIVDAILRAKVPSIASALLFAEAGTLFGYGPSPTHNFRRAAWYVDRILKGAKPGELAIEQPTKFEIVVNARTAKALGVTIPSSVLLRADRVIE